MSIKKIEFFPSQGHRNSPEDFLLTFCSDEESASIIGKLNKLREIPMRNWPKKWAKPVDEFKQLRHGDFRAFYQVIDNNIIVFHICRKVGNRIKKKDIRIARANLNDY